MAAATFPSVIRSTLCVAIMLVLGGGATAQELPEGYELIFSGSQDAATENLRFRTAYDSSATLGIFSVDTVGECAGLCDTRDACEGLFFQIPTTSPNNNCRILSVADSQMPRSTVTRSFSMRRLPRGPFTTEEPPANEGSRKSDRMTINDLHWGWWVFFGLLPIIIYLIVICCIKCRDKDEDPEDDDEDDKDKDKEQWDDSDLESGLVYASSAMSSRRQSQTSLALAQPRDHELAFFYETVAKNMKEENLVSDSDTDAEYFMRGHQEREFDADKYMENVVTAKRQTRGSSDMAAHKARQSLAAVGRPVQQQHFYPMAAPLEDAESDADVYVSNSSDSQDSSDGTRAFQDASFQEFGRPRAPVIAASSYASYTHQPPAAAAFAFGDDDALRSAYNFDEDFGATLLDLDDSDLTDSDLLQDASFA